MNDDTTQPSDPSRMTTAADTHCQAPLLWQPASKYRYELLTTLDRSSLSPQQQAQLLLYPPPDVPETVCQYLNREAEYYAVGKTVQQYKSGIISVQKRLDHVLQRTDAANNSIDPTLNDMDVDSNLIAAGVNVDVSRLSLRHPRRRHIGSRSTITHQRVFTQLTQLSRVITVDENACMRYVYNQHRVNATSTTTLVRHRRVKRKAAGGVMNVSFPPGGEDSDEELHIMLKTLGVFKPADEYEHRVFAATTTSSSSSSSSSSTSTSTSNTGGDRSTDNAIKVLQITRHRVNLLAATQRRRRQCMNRLQSEVLTWLQTLRMNRFDLTDGYLCLQESVQSQTMTKESVAQNLCEYLLLNGHTDPVKHVWLVVDAL
jgi:hypothetical protein